MVLNFRLQHVLPYIKLLTVYCMQLLCYTGIRKTPLSIHFLTPLGRGGADITMTLKLYHSNVLLQGFMLWRLAQWRLVAMICKVTWAVVFKKWITFTTLSQWQVILSYWRNDGYGSHTNYSDKMSRLPLFQSSSELGQPEKHIRGAKGLHWLGV